MHQRSQSTTNENTDVGPSYYRRSSSRKKSSSHVVPSPRKNALAKKNHTRTVRIRLVFIRIGEINTLNEQYHADIYFEARWIETMDVNLLKLDSKQQLKLLNQNLTIRIDKDKLDLNTIWTPKLFIENAIAQVGEQEKWFTVKKNLEGNLDALSPPTVHLQICEHRRLQGIFWEKLELYHFPADVQDLTVSITTHHYLDECEFLPDEQIRSSINREAFFDQQEWELYEHVATELRESHGEYASLDESDGLEEKLHAVLAVTCCAARRPGYYYWNGFCLIFLITVCSFCIFSIPPDLPQSRLQITCTLLLTSVTFRWVVNRSLPTISYLTTLDKYAIVSIIMLVLLCVWHSIIATIIFLNPDVASSKEISPTNVYVNVDRYIFICMFVAYIMIHLLLLVWLICVPYKRRREMERLDRDYAAKKHIKIETIRKRYKSTQTHSQDMIFRRTASSHVALPLAKSPIRSQNHSDGVTIIPNALSFLPIQEEPNEMTVELQEQDDVFYDHTNDINDELKNTRIQPIKYV